MARKATRFMPNVMPNVIPSSYSYEEGLTVYVRCRWLSNGREYSLVNSTWWRVAVRTDSQASLYVRELPGNYTMVKVPR